VGALTVPEKSSRRRADWTATRERVLAAAREVFSRQGFDRTTTGEVAAAAGVAEITLFRHFATKSILFEQAVAAYLRAAVDDVVARRRQASAGESIEQAVYTFFDEMLSALNESPGLATAALAALSFDGAPAEFHELPGAFGELMSCFEEALIRHRAELGPNLQPSSASWSMAALVLGVAAGEPLLGSGSLPQKRRARELARFVTYGLKG